MSSSVRILHYYFSVLPGFSARDSDISTCYFYEVKIACSGITVFSWETRYSWEILMPYPNTRRHLLEHMWKLGGGVVPITPTEGPRHLMFTSVEGPCTKIYDHDCTYTIQKGSETHNTFLFLINIGGNIIMSRRRHNPLWKKLFSSKYVIVVAWLTWHWVGV